MSTYFRDINLLLLISILVRSSVITMMHPYHYVRFYYIADVNKNEIILQCISVYSKFM